MGFHIFHPYHVFFFTQYISVNKKLLNPSSDEEGQGVVLMTLGLGWSTLCAYDVPFETHQDYLYDWTGL